MIGKLRVWLFLGLLTGLIASCQTTTPATPQSTLEPQPQVTRAELTLYPSWTPTPPPTSTPVPSATRTLIPSRTPTITLSPTPRLIPVYAPQTALTVDLLLNPQNNVLHDLIVFSSSSLSPFNISTTQNEAVEIEPRLWAVSPDGLRSGRLTFDDVPFAAYYPDEADQKPIFVEYGVSFNHPDLQVVRLPDECYGWLPEEEVDLLQGEQVESCSDFRFSLDGKYVAFFFGPTVCGRGMMLLDTSTSKVIHRSAPGMTAGFEFLENGKLIYVNTYCEGGTVHLLDPGTLEGKELGSAGSILWNAQHTAFIVAVAPYQGASGAVWGYNLTTDEIFLAAPVTWPLDNHPLWSPDGRYVIYQHRPLNISSDLEYSFNGARQILRVDSQSGEQQMLVGEEGYDYHLCAAPTSACDTWIGDWVQVRRYPFQKLVIPFDDDFFSNKKVTCLMYGIDCPFQADLLALNWQTGELLPWDESALLTSTQIPTQMPTPVPGPDLSSPPVYTHPQGRYAFYVGLDGRSIWLVAEDGTVEMWVKEGEGFLYLP